MIQFRSNGTRAAAHLKRLLGCAAGWLAVSLIQPASAGINTLTRVGPEGGSTHKVVFHPTDSSIVFATTSAGFYRSTDGGQTWALVSDRVYNNARDMAVHASQPNRVFVVAQGTGVFASNDAGATLSVLSSTSGFQFTSTEIEYSADGSVLYVSTGRQVYRSTNHGASWLQGGNIPIGNYAATSLIVDPTDPNRLYMIGDAGQGFQSADAGVSWQSWSVPNTTINALVIVNSQPTPRIWAATDTGIRFTDDRGVSWTNARAVIAQTIAVDPNDPAIVYAGTHEGLLRTEDNGDHWTNVQSDANTAAIQSIAIDLEDSEHVLMAGRAGIASSNDGGAHWAASQTGIDALSSYELASSPVADRVYINATANGVYALAADDGSTVPIDNQALRQLTGNLGFHGLGLTVVPGTPDRLFIATSRQVARSIDGGNSWSLHAVTSPQGIYQLANASADGSRLLATTGDRLFITADGGDTWAEGPAMGANDLFPIVSAASNPQVIYVSARTPGATRDAILRSTDGGNTWTTLSFPGTDVLTIAVDPSDDRTLYTGGILGEVYKSTNGGQSWASINIPGAYVQQGYGFWALAIDPQNTNIVYAGGGSFIARSVDGGASWQQLNYEPDRLTDLRSLVVDPLRPHSVYAAFNGNGVRELSVQPDLKIAATFPDIPAPYGIAASYSYHIINDGPFDATNVRTRIQLPAGVTNVTATSAAAPCTVADTVVTCTAPILRTDANAEITITVTHPAAGDVSIVATVEGDQPDASTADNSITSDVRVAEMTDLGVIVTGSSIVARGETVNLTLTVTNAGLNVATLASVTIELATGFVVSNITSSGGVSTCVTAGNQAGCQLPQLAAGASVTLTVTTIANAAPGGYTHMATVTSSGTDVRGGNNVAAAVTTISDVAQNIGTGNRGGGGGSASPFMLAALLLLCLLRAAGNKFTHSTRSALF